MEATHGTVAPSLSISLSLPLLQYPELVVIWHRPALVIVPLHHDFLPSLHAQIGFQYCGFYMVTWGVVLHFTGHDSPKVPRDSMKVSSEKRPFQPLV